MGVAERRFWDERSFGSRAAVPSDPRNRCFDAYVPHPICGWEPRLPSSVWRQIADAADRSTTATEPTKSGTPDVVWLLERCESLASSTIEGIHPSSRRVARAEAQLNLFGELPPESELQTVRNIHVSQQAIRMAESGRDLTLDDLRELHAVLMGTDDPIAGQIREHQNWVGGGALGGPLKARHVGPPPERVLRLLDDLLRYINHQDGDPVVRAATAHAQFETIHPFGDGNGRTGRALIQFMLRREGIVLHGSLPVSTALMIDKDEYFRALDTTRVLCSPDDPIRGSAIEPWLSMFAQAVNHGAVLRERLTRHVELLSEHWNRITAQDGVRPSNALHSILRALPSNPVITVKSVTTELGLNQRTTQRAITKLVELQILQQRSAGRRNRVFESGDMLDAFTEAVRDQPAASLALGDPRAS